MMVMVMMTVVMMMMISRLKCCDDDVMMMMMEMGTGGCAKSKAATATKGAAPSPASEWNQGRYGEDSACSPS